MSGTIQFVIILFILIGGYQVFGMNALILGACISVAYMYWFSSPVKTPIVIDTFIKSDDELIQALANLESETEHVPYDYTQIAGMVDSFIEIYLDCFCDQEVVKHAFSDLTSTRRDILNHVDRLNVNPEIIGSFEAATWKYIHILIKKYDLDYEYPIPHNEPSGQDVY